ncbi:hypothetical protein [Nocardia tengchongensis]|uniref:hypothetical protein n=1 Tax=Nocardia tengchongensis TaxID=2055889 RepID=UPI003613AB5B
MTVATDTGPPVTVLLDPCDDVSVTRALLGAHNPAAGVIVVHPTPATSSADALGADVIAALGRPVTRLTDERVSGGEAIWAGSASWLIADQIAHLVVLRAHRLRDRQRTRLLQLRWLTSVHLVLVWHTCHTDPATELDLIGIPHRVSTDLTDLLNALKPRRRHQPWLVTDHGDLPAVPLVDFAQFRATAARCLDRRQFQRIDTVYRHSAAIVCRALADHEGVPAAGHEHYIEHAWRERAVLGDDSAHLGRLWRRRPHGPVHDFVAEHVAPGPGSPRFTDLQWLRRTLGGLVADSPGRHYTVTGLRGAQAAFGLHGWYLELRSLPCAVGPGLTTIPFTAELAARIRDGLSSTVRAAALAVTAFTGALPAEMKILRGDHLAEDGSWIFSGPQGQRVFAVPTHARPLLLAARTYLELYDPRRQGLLIDATGMYGRTVRASVDACGILLPARHPYKHTWLANATAYRHWPRLRPSEDADLRYALPLDDHPRTTPAGTDRQPSTDPAIPVLRRSDRTGARPQPVPFKLCLDEYERRRS